MKLKKLYATLGVLFIVTGIIFSAGSRYITKKNPEPQKLENIVKVKKNTPISDITNTIADNNTTVPGIAKSSTSGVVGISVLKPNKLSLFEGKNYDKWGVGSGAIISPNGYILTNNHVAGGKNKRIIVSLLDGRNIDGTTVWENSILDLAIVKINASNLNALPLGNSDNLQVGETAVAIGNPFGLQFQRTVTSGIISALNRTIKIDTDQGTNYMEDLIQTDASINPGNSGGPLLNSRGEVIGINTVKVETAEGIGFAIPINVATPIIKQFLNTGNFKESYMGLFAYDKEIIPFLDSNLKIDQGIYVTEVDNYGPAYKSGLRVGCVITKIDDKEINTMLQLRTMIYSKIPGDTIYVTHISDGKTQVVPVTLESKSKDGILTR